MNLPLVLCVIFAYTLTSAAKESIGFKEWSLQNNTKINIKKEWNPNNPSPHRSYFKSDSNECIQSWFISLGPLGLNTIMHDRTWTQHYKACDKAKPQELSDNIGLIFNAFEVKIVKKNSPAKGKVKKGDLILAFDGQMIKESQLTFLGVPMHNKFLRGIEIDAGLAIDQAEGRGEISLLILRAPNSVKKELNQALIGLRKWKKITDVKGDFMVNVKDVDICRFSSRKKKAKMDDFKISNEAGLSFPYKLSNQKRTRLVNNQISIPKGSWQLSGNLKGTASVEILPRISLPKIFKKYLKVVKFKIPKIGSFGKSFDPNSLKARNYSQIIARRLALQQEEDGSWQTGGSYSVPAFHTSICGLGLLALDDPQYAEAIKKAAHYVARGSWRKWAYPAGVRLMFLSEYYLRTKDPTIKDAVVDHIKAMSRYILADYTAGHGTNPGYGGSGYIGAGSVIACGLAVASKTGLTDAEDILLLDKMLQRAQELAPDGTMPYGRSQRKTERGYSTQKGHGCGTGGYFFAASIRGTATLFKKAATKKFGLAPWGSAENGHAAAVLHFAWGMLASANCGNKALIGSMNAYLWRFTTHREFDGLINKNNYRTEYHNGDGVIGEPYWRTGSYLLLMNSYKKNLAISGKPIYQARKYRGADEAYHSGTVLLNYIKRNWVLVEAAMGKSAPKALTNGIAFLKKIKKDAKLENNLKLFIKKTAPVIAKEIATSRKKNQVYHKSQLIEMIYGVDLEVAVTPNLTPGTGIKTASRKSVSFNKKLFKEVEEPYSKRSKKEKKKKEKEASKLSKKIVTLLKNGSDKEIEYAIILRPISRIQDTNRSSKKIPSFKTGIFEFKDIKVTIIDPTGRYLKKPIVVNQSKLNSSGHFATVVSLPANVNTFFYASINYSLDGQPVEYKAKIQVPSMESRSVTPSLTRIFVKGTVSEDYAGYYTSRLKLNSGEIIGCEGNKFSNRAVLAGTPCLFEISPTGPWAHTVRSVKLYNPKFRVVLPQSITLSGGSLTGSVDKMRDMDNESFATITSPRNKPLGITCKLDKVAKISSICAKFNNLKKGTFSIEALLKGKWKTVKASASSGMYLPIIPVETDQFRFVFPPGHLPNIEVSELNFHLPAAKRGVSQIRREFSW